MVQTQAIIKTIWLLMLLPLSLISQSEDALFEIPRVESVVFDGQVTEEEWNHIAPVPLVQYAPDPGSPPTENTEIRFAYDDVYFYGSIRAFDSDPDGIRANSLYRDRLAGSDHFEILLDSYNDNENAFIFSTIPTGVRNDVAVRNDATGGTIFSGGWLNRDFNTFWDAAVSQDEDGWYAEIRIPFKSLRFQNVDGKVIMGLSAQRKIARKLERVVFPNIGPISDWAFLRPSLAQKILIRDIEPSKTVYITPYVLGGLSRNNVLNDAGTAYEKNSTVQRDIGGEVKYSVSPNLTVDFTVNTDFAQAEADDQLVNLSRFSLFFPEKRQFFQERAGIFEFRTGGISRLFFSRRIGLSEDGRSIPVIGGARMVGRFDTWDIGLLNMHTQSVDELNAENFGVVRLRKRAFNENSYVGGMLTSRIASTGKRNLVYGVDGLVRLFGDDYLSYTVSQSFENDDVDVPGQPNNNSRVTFELNRRRRSGFGYNLGFIYSGKEFNPGVGFLDREDFKFFTTSVSHTKIFPEGSPFIWQTFQMKGLAFVDNGTEQIISGEINPEWSFSSRGGDQGSLGAKWIYENLFSPFVLDDEASIPVGEYRFLRYGASYRMAGERILRTGIEVETGKFYDGILHTLSISPSWFVSKHLELGLQYVFNSADFDDRGESFTAHITRLRLGTAVNSKISTNALFQYNSNADIFSANIRFRYNFKEGNDLWIVLNEGINTDRASSIPRLPFSQAESILIKYLHTFLF